MANFLQLQRLQLRRALLLLAFVLPTLFATALPSKAAASTIVKRSIEEMSARADAVARGEVLSVEALWHEGSIATLVRVQVREPWAGTLPEVVDLWIPGGQIDGVRAQVSGMTEFHVGDDVIVFLQQSDGDAWRTLALSWSIYLCEDAVARRSGDNFAGVRGSSNPVISAARAHAIAQDHELPISTFRDRVKAASR